MLLQVVVYFLGVVLLEQRALTRGIHAGKHVGNVAGERAVRSQNERAFAIQAGGGRRKHRHLQHLAVGSIGQIAVRPLQFSADQAQRRFLVGRIKDEQGLAVRGLYARRKPSVIFSIRQFDGSDHMVANQGRSRRIDDAAFTVHVQIVGSDADRLKHRDKQSGFVFAIAIAVAVNVAGIVRLQTANALHDDEVADVFLDIAGEPTQFGVEIGRSRNEFLSLGGDLGRGIGPMRFELILPQAESTPLVVDALNGVLPPHHRHVSRQCFPRRGRMEIFQIERGNVRNLPTQVVISCLDRRDRLEMTPRFGIMAARRQRQLKRLIHNRNRVLYSPGRHIHVGPEIVHDLAGDDGAGIVSGRPYIPGALGELGIRVFIVPHIDEIRIHGLKLSAVGGDRPRVEGVQLCVDVVIFTAVAAFAPLRLENANDGSLTFDGAILLVDGNEIVVEQEDGRGIADVCRRRRSCGINRPIRRRLRFFFGCS